MQNAIMCIKIYLKSATAKYFSPNSSNNRLLRMAQLKFVKYNKMPHRQDLKWKFFKFLFNRIF